MKPKYRYCNVIDVALKGNQLRAITSIIDFIVAHQNSYVSSFLFTNNLAKVLEKGIDIEPLLSSDIFVMKFDYDEWPSFHSNN